jgi:hypothetical protein
MGIEQNIERVANAMERIADNLDRLVVCADFHLERAQMMDASKGVESPKVREVMAKAEVTVEPETPAPAAEPEFTYDELKAKLIERGVEIPKSTKMTTLLKLWAVHKDAPVFAEQEIPFEPEAVVEEAPAEVVDPFDAPVPAEEKPFIPDNLSLEDARGIIEQHYDRSDADKANLIAAFAEAGQGISTFGAIPAGKYGAVVRKFLELKGVSL